MKCYYHPYLDAVGQCTQCGKFCCHQCIVDVGSAMLCLSCQSRAGQQMTLEEARFVAQAKRAVTVSSLLAVALFVFTAITTMTVSVQSDGNMLSSTLVLFSLVFSSYLTWAGFWGFGPVYRAFKASISQTGCFLLAPPLAWLVLFLVGGMLLFLAAECYGACGIAIARHRKAALISKGQLPPQPF